MCQLVGPVAQLKKRCDDENEDIHATFGEEI
jgi:hypothetical protein